MGIALVLQSHLHMKQVLLATPPWRLRSPWSRDWADWNQLELRLRRPAVNKKTKTSLAAELGLEHLKPGEKRLYLRKLWFVLYKKSLWRFCEVRIKFLCDGEKIRQTEIYLKQVQFYTSDRNELTSNTSPVFVLVSHRRGPAELRVRFLPVKLGSWWMKWRGTRSEPQVLLFLWL